MSEPADFQERIDRHFDDFAEFWKDVYDDLGLLGSIFRERRDRTLAWIDGLGLASDARVLEVGCGAASLAIEIARRGYLVDAIDPSETMVELARREVKRAGATVRLATGDVHRLSFPDRTFDVVVALGVLPWLHTPLRGLQEMARVLASPGHLVVTCDNRAALQRLLDPRLLPALEPLKAATRRRLGRPQRPRTFAAGELRSLLEQAGLEEAEHGTIQFGPFSFLGAKPLGERAGARVHRRLQRMADRGRPLVRSAGMQHMVLARKT